MAKTRTMRVMGRTLRDMTLGLALFVAITVIGAANAGTSIGAMLCNAAEARVMPTDPYLAQGLPFASPGTPNPTRTLVAAGVPELPTMVTLALVFAGIVAFDLWFYRHLRRAYAGSRTRS